MVALLLWVNNSDSVHFFLQGSLPFCLACQWACFPRGWGSPFILSQTVIWIPVQFPAKTIEGVPGCCLVHCTTSLILIQMNEKFLIHWQPFTFIARIWPNDTSYNTIQSKVGEAGSENEAFFGTNHSSPGPQCKPAEEKLALLHSRAAYIALQSLLSLCSVMRVHTWATEQHHQICQRQ